MLDKLMDKFLDDINKKLKQPTSNTLNSSNIMSNNQENPFLNKLHTSYVNNQSYSQPHSNVGLNNRLLDQSSRFAPNNSFMDGSQVPSLFRNHDRQYSDHLGSTNGDSSFFYNLGSKINDPPYYNLSNQTQQISNGNDRSKRYLNDISSQCSSYNNFKRPLNVRDELNTQPHVTGRYQKSNHLGVANEDQSFMLSRPVSGNMPIASPFLSEPTFSLLDLKEEFTTTMAVMDILNLDMGISLEEMEVCIIIFLMKFKKTVQKLLVNLFPTEASLNSVNISSATDKVQYIKQWLSSNFGSNNLINKNTNNQQDHTRTTNNLGNYQQNANTSRMESAYEGSRETSCSPFSYSVLSEGRDSSLFNYSNKLMSRDQSKFNPSEITNCSNLNNTTVASTKSNKKKSAKQPTKQQKTHKVKAEKELEIGTAEPALANTSIQVSSKGRIIKPKSYYWENSNRSTLSTTIIASTKRNIVTGSNGLNTTVKEKTQTISKQEDVVFKEPSAVLNKIVVPKQKPSRPASTPELKKVKGKATKVLNQSNTSMSSTTKKNNNQPASANQNIKSETKKKAPSRRMGGKENVPIITSPIVVKREKAVAPRGRKRPASLDKSVTVKKTKLDNSAVKYTFDDSFNCLKSEDVSRAINLQHNLNEKALNNNKIKPIVNSTSQRKQSKSTGYSGLNLDNSKSSKKIDDHNVSAKVQTKANKNSKQNNTKEQVNIDLGVTPLPVPNEGKSYTLRTKLTSVAFNCDDSFSSWGDEYNGDNFRDLI